MNQQSVTAKSDNKILAGIGLAILATIIWSGNFVVARGVIQQIPPVGLAFFRWLLATALIGAIAWKTVRQDIVIIRKSYQYLFWVALTGIALFNTFVYVAAHYTPAINLALVGTTSSPIMATVLAVIFLKERLSILRITGIVICVAGILILLSKGSIDTLLAFRFSKGDWWVLLGALMFAIYNTLVKRKPVGISALSFLFIIFLAGTLMLFPFFLIERANAAPIQWNTNLFLIILYLGAGTSVVSFLCWNAAIARLGSARTALFGNLIPIFSSIEAVIFLGEKITGIHIISAILVFGGLLVANLKKSKT